MSQVSEYLAFYLGGKEYGIDVQNVQEIRSYEEPTRIPRAPAFVKGVINLRGMIVPIIDLRVKLGCTAEFSFLTTVIVLSIGNRTVGAVVDSISEIVALQPGQIEPVAECSPDEAGFVVSTATIGERVFMLMDLSGLVSDFDETTKEP